MVARAVIGANFGDEGKGLVVDYLARTGDHDVVVRFNGGVQAGHTVVTPEGKRHVFGHFGSGTFCKLPTFFAQACVVNPLLAAVEHAKLREMGVTPPKLYVHPACRVTTPIDMIINQVMEKNAGHLRHGSCGVGFNETIQRDKALPLSMFDIWSGDVNLLAFCERLQSEWAQHRLGATVNFERNDGWVKSCEWFAKFAVPAYITQFNAPLFEGAQGLLLDRDRIEFFPHLTNSYTGMRNVRELCKEAEITAIEPWYVSRTYLTRHGAGPLPGEQPVYFEDKTNVLNPWQGPLRFAPLDADELLDRVSMDAGNEVPKIVFTHCDQLMTSEAVRVGAHRYVYGETADDVYPRPLDSWEANYEKIASATA